MLRLFEKYLAGLGESVGMLVLAAVLIWASIILAVVVYAFGVGILAVARISLAAYGGGPWQIFLAVIVWLLLLLSVLPARAGRRVWHDYQREQLESGRALSRVEERAFGPQGTSSNVNSPRERLCRRALDTMETELLGEPLPPDLAVAERIIELDRRAADPGDDDGD